MVGPDNGGVAFTEIDDVLKGDDGKDKFMEPENTLDLQDITVPAGIEDPSPGLGRCSLQSFKGRVFDPQERSAGRACIDEIEDVITLSAPDACIDQRARDLGHVRIRLF
jgi:hypothetical protein